MRKMRVCTQAFTRRPNFHDALARQQELRRVRRVGFTGKIHLTQVQPVHQVFSPAERGQAQRSASARQLNPRVRNLEI